MAHRKAVVYHDVMPLLLFLFSYTLITEDTTMGLSKLNIFVSEIGDPCCISNDTWYISIFKCDGTVLDWCGHRYLVIQ